MTMMRKGGVVAGVIVLGGGILLIAVPILMVMVLMGGQGDMTGTCGPGAGSVALAGEGPATELDDDQLANASKIVSAGRRLSVPRRAIVIALAVANQESGFRNYANDGVGQDLKPDQRGIEESLSLPHDAVGSDHGSLGVFQQQWPWWGSMPELMNPTTAAERFYTALLKVRGWRNMEVTDAGQAVQKSAYPDAYADDVELAEALADEAPVAGDSAQSAVYFGGTASGGCGVAGGAFPGKVVHPLPSSASYVDLANHGDGGPHWESTHTGTDLSSACGTSVVAATSGQVTVRTDQAWSGKWLVEIASPGGEVTTWYAHMQAIHVRSGDEVTAGQQIGEVGSLGNSTGCHLHFEVYPSDSPKGVDPTRWLGQNVGQTISDFLPAAGTDDVSHSMETATLLTGNVPFTISERRARAQIRYLLARQPDVLVLQEVTSRNVRAIVADLPGSWAVLQPEGSRGGSAIVWNSERFRASRHGVAFGFDGSRYDRWIPWVLLESDHGTLPVAAIHMPPKAGKDAVMARHFRTMTANYRELVREMSNAGYPPVIGGDWNHSLQRRAESWSPVPMLRGVGLTTNWREGTPCMGTMGRARFDGFAFNPDYLGVVDQGCLDSRASDHRPVWVALAPIG